MNPKEQAQALVDKFKPLVHPKHMEGMNAKQCALIAVDMRIDTYKAINLILQETEVIPKAIEYWQQVKEEIEHL